MPIQPTAAQSAASRQNGARSTGPKTETGKKSSSTNALRHGFRTNRFTLAEEERALADEFRHDLVARVMPVDALERGVVEAMVVCEIKLARLDELEMRVLDQALADDLGGEEQARSRLPSLSTLDRYRGRIMRERRELENRLEKLKAARGQYTGQNALRPEALRYLADLVERKESEVSTDDGSETPVSTPSPSNDNLCTNKPEKCDKLGSSDLSHRIIQQR